MSVSPEIVSHWDAYLAEEKSGVRSVALAQLDTFIASLLGQSEADWQNWAFNLSETIVDHQRDIPVRMPLFRSVIFPALHSRLNAGSGGAARILAGFSQLLYHSPECRDMLPSHLRTEHGLILEAISRDSSDTRSKQRMRAILRGRFEYSLHEIPSGVLYGQDGATVEECSEMISELKNYENLCSEIGAEDEDREIIDEASYYIPAYRDYLIDRGSHVSFASYIETHARNNGNETRKRAITEI
jgi:hypothetical protein